MAVAASSASLGSLVVSSSLASEVRWLMENVVVPLEVVPLLVLPLLFLWAVHLQVGAMRGDNTGRPSPQRSAVPVSCCGWTQHIHMPVCVCVWIVCLIATGVSAISGLTVPMANDRRRGDGCFSTAAVGSVAGRGAPHVARSF